MKRWAILTAILYAIILAALAWPLVCLAFAPNISLLDAFNIYTNFASAAPNDNFMFFTLTTWIWVAVMVLAQVALLVVPVKIAGRRPVSRRALIWPVLAAVAMMLVMAVATGLAVWECLSNLRDAEGEHLDEPYFFLAIVIVGAVWLTWGFLFGFYTGNREPTTFMSRLVKSLLAGSILELLVAVPTHVFCRMKDHCCGGYLTFWGLATGLSVMLLAFGPGVFLLFVRRWASLRRTSE